VEDSLERFARLVRAGEDALDLAEGALAIGGVADPGLDPALWLAELDRLARDLTGLDDLIHRLFLQAGFVGNTRDFYDPGNSFLHRVIERRRGIPITLSVLTIEVGRRAGIQLQGIGMPGHFLVRDPATKVYLDPFHGGEIVDDAACERLFREATGSGPETPFGSDALPLMTKTQTLARILANLKVLYRIRRSPRDLEWVIRMRLALPDVSAIEAVHLGEALAMQGRFLDAAKEVEARAGADPQLTDTLLSAAKSFRSRMN
jgi:regulator of sirC expression with transglutaminase-like and TPR domain